MMKQFQLRSFVLGLVSGTLLVFLVSFGLRLTHSGASAAAAQQGQFGGNRQMNTARMAQRLGITEAALQQELASGKTMQDIFAEHGVAFGRGPRTGTGAVRTGSGRTLSGSVTSASSSVSQ